MIPKNFVSMEVGSRVEPQVKIFLPLPRAIGEEIGVQEVWLPRHIAEELEIYLVVVVTVGNELQNRKGDMIQPVEQMF